MDPLLKTFAVYVELRLTEIVTEKAERYKVIYAKLFICEKANPR